MSKTLIILLTFFIIICTSCFEDDERIVPIEIDEVQINQSLYEYQVYYSITNNAVVSFNNYAEWDLGFECSDNGYHVILNYARFMYAGNTFKTDFSEVKSASNITMSFDHSSGDLDQTVLKDWVDLSVSSNPVFNNYVYVIDRGKNEQGESFGTKKIMVEKMENDTFYVHFANIDGSEEYRSKIPKSKNKNFTLFSLDNGGEIVDLEPEKDIWSICFTKYSTIIPDNYGTPTDYLVRGVFLNPNKNIEVALDTVNHYYEIMPDMINDYNYSNVRDAIGYDWKVYRNDVYEIRDYNSYVLKNVDGKNYKLRFTNFYNDAGEKGFPAFELIEL